MRRADPDMIACTRARDVRPVITAFTEAHYDFLTPLCYSFHMGNIGTCVLKFELYKGT